MQFEELILFIGIFALIKRSGRERGKVLELGFELLTLVVQRCHKTIGADSLRNI